MLHFGMFLGLSGSKLFFGGVCEHIRARHSGCCGFQGFRGFRTFGDFRVFGSRLWTRIVVGLQGSGLGFGAFMSP